MFVGVHRFVDALLDGFWEAKRMKSAPYTDPIIVDSPSSLENALVAGLKCTPAKYRR